MANVPLFNEKCKYILSDFEFLQDPADRNCKLGSGSFASVKLAKERKTGNLYALKVVRLHTNKPSLANEIYNIKAEIYIHRKLNHTNIIKFHDYIQNDSTVYLVLDYAENGNLYTYLHRRKFLQEKEIFRFFYQTCQAINYLHENDVIHRDIKPENLLLDSKNNIKLCDFGWATQRIKDKRVTFCGTYEYMAPEIVHKRPYDYRVDIWSLGVLLYELIHGESPYKGRSLPEIVKSLARGLVKFSYNCNSEAKDLIQKLLKQNPNDRLNLHEIMTHPWVLYHLSKEDNSVAMTLPKERILLHSHSLPAEIPEPKSALTTKNTSVYELYKESTPVQSKTAVRNENWTELYQKRQSDYEKVNNSLYTPTNDKNTKNFHTTNIALNISPFDDSGRAPLQPCSSNQNLLNLNLKPFDESIHEPARERSHSPISPFHQSDQIRTPPDSKNKIFETNIFSPSFKNKLTNVIRQLTVTGQPNTKKASDKVINQTTIPSANQNISIGYINQQDRSYCQATMAREEARTFRKEENKSMGMINSSSVNSLQPRQDIRPTQLNHMKNLKEPMSLPKGDDFPIILSSTSTTRTNTSDISYGPDMKSPSHQNGNIRFPVRNDKETICLISDRTRMNKPVSISTNPNPIPKDKQQQPQGNFNKKALELKGMLGPGIIRYHIPITLSTTRNARNNKENLR